MRLLSLSLTQFRNYTSQEFDLNHHDIHLFVGKNGSGKTNLLEAMSVLSLTKSCLNAEEEDLRQWGTEFYRVRARVLADNGEEKQLEIVSQWNPRRAKGTFLNDVRVAASAIVGQFPTVIFLPQDLDLFTGSPADRRRFLDLILSQVSPDYFDALSQYQRILKQRNALLRQIAEGTASEDALNVWDQEIAEKGSILTIARLELIEILNVTLGEEVRALGEQWSETNILYERQGCERESKDLQLELMQLLAQNRNRDRILQTTSVGPHRDDFSIEADGHSLKTSASRGQQRIAVLALLLLEASFLQIRRNEKPVILLDDIFSELDAEHQESVLRALTDHQVILTATHVPPGLKDARVWEVEQGTVRPGNVYSFIR